MSSNTTSPTATPSDYSHLTQKERMIAGFPYNSEDNELNCDRNIARQHTEIFNDSTLPEEIRVKSIRELFNPDCFHNKYSIQQPIWIDYGYNIFIGQNVTIGPGCVILDSGPIRIGDGSVLGTGVHLYGVNHPIDSKHRLMNNDYYELTRPVTIGKSVRIEDDVIICPDVNIGDGSLVCFGSVVTKSVPSGVVVAGNPARICLRDRNCFN